MCNVHCLKKMTKLFAIVTILVGLASLGISITFLVKGSMYWGVTGTAYYSIFWLSLGVLLIILGVLGKIGAQKKNNCCLFFYNISLIIFSFCYLALAILGTVFYYWYGTNMLSKGCDSSQKEYQWINTLNDYYASATSLFGTSSCVAYSSTGICPPYYPLGAICSPTGYSSVSACLTPTQMPESDSNFFQTLEKNFDCSGICQNPGYEIFNNNLILTNSTCLAKIQKYLNNFSVWSMAIAYPLSFILFLGWIAGCCLCCHKDNKNAGGDYYSKMNYYEA